MSPGDPPVNCMTAEEWASWAEVNRLVRIRSSRPCSDCTLEFASAMRVIGACNGTPMPRPGRRPLPSADQLAGMTYAELRAMYEAAGYVGRRTAAPVKLRTAMRRARWREWGRNRRVTA